MLVPAVKPVTVTGFPEAEEEPEPEILVQFKELLGGVTELAFSIALPSQINNLTESIIAVGFLETFTVTVFEP